MNSGSSTGSLLQRVLKGSIAASTLLVTAACGNSSVPVDMQTPTVPVSSTTLPTVTSAPSKTPTPSQTRSETAKPSPSTTTSTVGAKTPVTSRTEASPPSGQASNTPTPVVKSDLQVGEGVRLDNWEVTVMDGEYGRDGISYGFKVDVCYIAPSSFAKDGRIKVSDAVWSVLLEDMESNVSRVVSVPVAEFERDHSYRPDYLDTTLAVGECNLGWIGIVHGNPDLAFHGITYSPSTGEKITWKN